MDEDLIVVFEEEDIQNETTIENIDVDVQQTETVELIEVNEQEDIEIEIDEAVGWGGRDSDITHYSLPDRDRPDQHPIGAITGLQETLDLISTTRDCAATHGGYAELIQWKDTVYDIGYFVSLSRGNDNNLRVDLCGKDADVYGVTVSQSAFYGYQDSRYNFLDDGTNAYNKITKCAKVCLLGNIDVRIAQVDWENVQIGDYVVPHDTRPGYAKKSDSNIGFKVIARGQKESSGVIKWWYVTIALVPQNDNVSRVMDKLKEAQGSIGDINIQLGEIKENIKDTTIQLGKDFEGLENLVGEATSKIETQIPAIDAIVKDVQESVEEVKEQFSDVQTQYGDALNRVNEAKADADEALQTVSTLRTDMDVLAQWPNNVDPSQTTGIAGFVAKATADSITIGNLVTQVNNNETNVISVINQVKNNEASIQQLVARVNRYTLGEYSLSKGLTYEAASSILKPGHIYVPTEDHTESGINFVVGKSYVWKIGDTPDVYTWIEYKDVQTEYTTSAHKDDLWYCRESVEDGDEILYDAGTLYLWDGNMWVSVATIDGNIQARSLGLLKQTADALTVTYTNLDDKVSMLEQDVDGFETIVQDTKEGLLTDIQQNADDINALAISTEGKFSSLQLTVDGIQTISNYGGRVCIARYLENPNPTERYSQPPMWDDSEFNFIEATLDENGVYYPYPNDKTKYCKIVDDGYEVYTIGNEAMTLIRTQVDENKSELQSMTDYKTQTSENITRIEQKADANSAEISSVVNGTYVVCSDKKLNLTAEDISTLPTANRYDSAPAWDVEMGKFIFEGNISTDGIYCGNDTCYYKLLLNADKNIIGYEKYELDSSGLATIIQKVTKNGSSIGMIVDDDGVKGSILVEAINGTDSEVKISADHIEIDGVATFVNAKTTIEYCIVDFSIAPDNYNWNEEEWSTKPPRWKNGYYIWSRSVEVLSDGGTMKTDPILNEVATNANQALVQWCLNNDATVIDGGKIAANTILSNSLHTDAIKSLNYDYTSGTFADIGTFLNLANGSITSKNFAISADGDAYFKGQITATSGYIGNGLQGFTIKDTYISNGQSSLNSTIGGNGVYIGVDGIGLGNGVFKVTNAGDVTMKGSIVLGGSITWNATSSPVQVLYQSAEGYKINPKPTDGKSWDEFSERSTNGWHRVFQETQNGAVYADVYASYTYDGGVTWGAAIKIVGQDGAPGQNGTNATVTADKVFDVLTDHGYNQGLFSAFYADQDEDDATTKLFINAEKIRGEKLEGLSIISATDLNLQKNVVRIQDGFITFHPQSTKDTPKIKIGHGQEGDIDVPFIQIGAGSGIPTAASGVPITNGSMVMSKDQQAFHMNFRQSNGVISGVHFFDKDVQGVDPGIHINSPLVDFQSVTKVDFTGVNVTGLELGSVVAVFG